ncbi:hypothetical protein [Paraburkholderia dinghuensis]|uniref:Uncharacterized protein n=1 Tax=Paraburkholderia dinghuensis TaxID=2305225 RepID=A0A3N6NCH7_9BURK|nr:hypothetical protein [Paraburkholderia dinghuensis]RQH09001.1 hypothetical protein D1Y85_03800 [Paraburkholderia dinghuensis]
MTLIDQEIAHIARVMMPSMQTASGIPILPPAYWHKRLLNLLDRACLSRSQFYAVDRLMIQIEYVLASAITARVYTAA